MHRKSESSDKKKREREERRRSQNGAFFMLAISVLLHKSEKSAQTHEPDVPFITYDFVLLFLDSWTNTSCGTHHRDSKLRLLPLGREWRQELSTELV